MEWYEIVFRVLFSAGIGMAIGFQREHSGHPAGIKTHAMVCIGSAVISLIQLEMYRQFPDIDPSRIIAQIVSGIGFIGAGCILYDRNNNNKISGITTASTLWVAACLSIAAGLGYYEICLIAFIAVLLILLIVGLIRTKKGARGTEASSEENEDSEL